jgi:energy-coupling factor transporter ATP-binding protein EcfA2
MKVTVKRTCPDHSGYRTALVKSLFNVEDATTFTLKADLPLEERPWSIGLVVGPSGSGKTSLGRELFGADRLYQPGGWPEDRPIVEAILPKGDWQAVTAALAAVGLGSVPAWLRPYHVLSMGERFRADLARIVSESPETVVVDEFTSVVDRQIAKIGALAFAKSWRRTQGQAVLLSCHYDIVEWLQPDWTFDTGSGVFQWGAVPPRPGIELAIRQTGWEYWPHFEPHHYLKLPHMIAATNYVGFVDGRPVAHVAVSTRSRNEARACRLVILPEWQGAGVGLRFLNAVCDMWRHGENRYGRPMPTLFHTSHPGLAAALRRRREWTQVSARLYGENKLRSAASIARSAERHGSQQVKTGYGGHFRAVQGFRYLGKECACEQY